MSFNNSYGEEPGRGRASWASPGAAASPSAVFCCPTHLPAPMPATCKLGQGGGEATPTLGRCSHSAHGPFFQAREQEAPLLALIDQVGRGQ